MDYKRVTDSGYDGEGTPENAVPSREYINSVCDRLRAAVSGAGSYASPLGESSAAVGSGHGADYGGVGSGTKTRGEPRTGTFVWGLDAPPTASALRSPSRSHSYAKPPRFDGKDMSWDEFILQFSTVASINGWGEHEMGQQLFVNLEGDARSFVVGLRLPRMDYQTLVSEIRGVVWVGFS